MPGRSHYFLSCLVFLSAPSSAEDVIETITVVANRTPGPLAYATVPVDMLVRETIDGRAGRDVADLNHIAPGVGGGAVTAALFLREFVGGRRWAHLDIAGTGRSDVDAGSSTKGATGFGTRLLLRWLEEMA